jgi:hypothetical protein
MAEMRGTSKLPMTPSEARYDHRQMLRFLAANALAGAIGGLFIFLSLLAFDTGGIGTLISNAKNPVLPALLIAIPMCLTFAAAVAASAVMLMPYQRKYAEDADEK